MQNERQYTLMDEGFARFVSRVGEGLSSQGINYAVTGNVAVQAHILDRCSAREIEGFRTYGSHNLRPTNTVDFAIIPSGNDIELLKKIKAAQKAVSGEIMSFDGEDFFKYTDNRLGSKRATFNLETLSEEELLHLKLIHGAVDMNGFGANFYNQSIQSATEIKLPFEQKNIIPILVMKPEYVLAAKVVRREPQDMADIASLSRALNRHAKDRGALSREVRKLVIGKIKPEEHSLYESHYEEARGLLEAI